MSQVDDILYQPVPKQTPIEACHQKLLDGFAQALNGSGNFEFHVESSVPISVYDQMIDLVDADPIQQKYLPRMVKADPSLRPSNALSMRDVFRRMHSGERKFYHCGKASSSGSQIGIFEFANIFGVFSMNPFVQLNMGKRPSNCFEWWAAGLDAGYAGYNGHYSFGTEDEARKYYHSP